MCGIFGYVGEEENNSVAICLEGLRQLEYRGYDSAGIAGSLGGVIKACKTAGRVKDLEDMVSASNLQLSAAIAHTRWATHGKPTHFNAHPHFDEHKNLAIVHNGIIENYTTLKESLIAQGVSFSSDTDTEIIAHLISLYYEGDLLKAFRKALELLEGSWAIALIHKDHPQMILAAAKETPLVIAYKEDFSEIYLSSDLHALKKDLLQVLFIENGDVAQISKRRVDIMDSQGQKKEKKSLPLSLDPSYASKGEFKHFMLKEIFEQSTTIRRALEKRINEFLGTAHFDELTLPLHELQSISRILILGCGTSYHAGCIAASMLEKIAHIPTQAEIASEFRYGELLVNEETLVIAISQSGETADTLAAVSEVKKRGAKVIGICNVPHSKLIRDADSSLLLHAGPEMSVCSTKAFTSQLTVLALFTLFMGRIRHLSIEDGQKFIKELKLLPYIAEEVLKKASVIQSLAKKYADYSDFFFMGRRCMYIASLEAALKLKEISYLNASGYAAGEMKHGPIALIDENILTVALCGHQATYPKLVSNIMEIKARSGVVLAFANETSPDLENCTDDVCYLPTVCDSLAPIPYSIATQLLAYYIALQRGTDIDKPRNLAKSVTVE